MPLFPSEEWGREFCRRINESVSYRRAARGWVWPILFIVDELPDDLRSQFGERVGLLVKLDNGECRGIEFYRGEFSLDAPFVISARYSDWMELIERGMNPVTAIVRRKLRLVKGSYSTILRFPKAAIELVKLAKEVGV